MNLLGTRSTTLFAKRLLQRASMLQVPNYKAGPSKCAKRPHWTEVQAWVERYLASGCRRLRLALLRLLACPRRSLNTIARNKHAFFFLIEHLHFFFNAAGTSPFATKCHTQLDSMLPRSRDTVPMTVWPSHAPCLRVWALSSLKFTLLT